MSMKKSNDTIGNRTRDLPACSAVPQPTALPRAPEENSYLTNFIIEQNKHFKLQYKNNLQGDSFSDSVLAGT